MPWPATLLNMIVKNKWKRKKANEIHVCVLYVPRAPYNMALWEGYMVVTLPKSLACCIIIKVIKWSAIECILAISNRWGNFEIYFWIYSYTYKYKAHHASTYLSIHLSIGDYSAEIGHLRKMSHTSMCVFISPWLLSHRKLLIESTTSPNWKCTAPSA